MFQSKLQDESYGEANEANDKCDCLKWMHASGFWK